MVIFLLFLFYCIVTLATYQCFSYIQKRLGFIWLNPMMLSMVTIIPFLIINEISFKQYYQYTQVFSYLLEPAIVALGYPLYQQLQTIKSNASIIFKTLAASIMTMLVINVLLTFIILNSSEVAVSLALKSVTTPIGLSLAEDLNGIAAITAVGIIVAGIVGGAFGIRFLSFVGVTCPKAQGLGVGCASHALGTATITPISSEHGAFSSLALVLSAVITAVMSPIIIPLLLSLLNA